MLPPAFQDGLRHFNAGRFFEAHESFEDQLDACESDDRWDLLVALIQIAVGYHKLINNYVGGERMLTLGNEKLAPFAGDAHGIAIGALRARVENDLARLAANEDMIARIASDPPRLLPAR